MTYLEAGNASYANARKALTAGNYAAAARDFDHAKRMFEHHEWQHGSTKSPAIQIAAQYLRQAIRLRDSEAR